MTQQNSSAVTTAFEVSLPKDIIEYNLSCLAPEVKVTASQLTEDGYTLVLEGDGNQIADLVYLWGASAK